MEPIVSPPFAEVGHPGSDRPILPRIATAADALIQITNALVRLTEPESPARPAQVATRDLSGSTPRL